MDWVDKLNQWALKRIRGEATERVEADQDGIVLIRARGNQLIRWSEIEEIAAMKQPQLADGSFALAIRRADSAVAVVDDTVTGFAEFCQELTRRLTNVVPYERWAVELVASSQEDGKVIFRRPAS